MHVIPLQKMKVLVVCRGPIAEEVLRVCQELGMVKPDLVISQQEWLDTLDNRASWIRNTSRFVHAHKVSEYSNMDKIIEIALAHHIDTIYVGYGFLAENHEFARKCEMAGLRFAGPSSQVLQILGSKEKSRIFCESLNIPVIPGVDGFSKRIISHHRPENMHAELMERATKLGMTIQKEKENFDVFLAYMEGEARRLGYDLFTEEEFIQAVQRETLVLWEKHGKIPIRIKAASGGGGKGQRVVSSIEDVPKSLREVWSEIGAAGVGSNKSIILELNLSGPRHLEVQILGDGTDVVHFGVRDCSLQTTFYQKALEIALHEGMLVSAIQRFSGISPLHEELEKELALVRNLQNSAVKLCKQSQYRGAATVEFLVDENYNHYFIEVNSRLQVEHGVTEEVSRVHGRRVSLVAEQLRIAAGERLGFSQEDISFTGYALETRISLLDSNTLLPAPGATIEKLSFPKGRGIRIEDSGIEYALSCYPKLIPSSNYDANIALNIYHGQTWEEVLQKAIKNLQNSTIQGKAFSTTIPFHLGILSWFTTMPILPRIPTNFIPAYLYLVNKLKNTLEAEVENKIMDFVSRNQRSPKLWQTIVRDLLCHVCHEPGLAIAWGLQHTEQSLSRFKDRPWETLFSLQDYIKLPLWPEDKQLLHDAREFFISLESIQEKLGIPQENFWDTLEGELPPQIRQLGNLIAEVEKVSLEEALQALKKKVYDYRKDLVSFTSSFIAILQEFIDNIMRCLPHSTKIAMPSGLEEENARKKFLEIVQKKILSLSNEQSKSVLSPIQGIFYITPKPGAPAFVKIKQKVKKGQTLCIVGAMKVYCEVQAPYDAIVAKISAKNESLVVPGQELILLEISESIESSWKE